MTRDFVHDRPRDLRGVSEQLSELAEWGRGLQPIAGTRTLVDSADRVEWMLAREEVVEWAQAVTQRVDAQRAERLPWVPRARNVFWNEEQVFDAHVAAALSLVLRLRVWADEVDILDEPAPETVIVDADTPFSSWLRIGSLISSATSEVWVTDPYINDDALTLFLNVPSGAALRLLTRQGKGQTPDAWQRFCRQRGGLNECRFAPTPTCSTTASSAWTIASM